jgi:DNA polymerase-3 subunit gamma/tau
VLANAPLPSPTPRSLPPSGGGGGSASALRVEAPMAVASAQPQAVAETMPTAAPQVVAQPALATVASYKDLIALATAKREVLVKLALESQMRPISFEQGRIEVALADNADPGMIATLSARLQAWTGQRWLVMVSTKPPEGKTIRQEREQRKEEATAAAHEDPLVKAILETFPGAKLVNVSVRDEEAATPEIAPAPIEEDDE